MLKQSLRNYDKGFTIPELMVASTISLVLLGLALSTFLTNRRLVRYDIDRTMVQQNLRGAMDIMGMNVRLAGENLSANFPALEVVNGSGDDPDELILRRNIRDEVLKLCFPVTAGTNEPFYFAIAGEPGCAFGDQIQNYNSWSSYLAAQGEPVRAYIFEPFPSPGVGEFFTFNAVTQGVSDMYLSLPGAESWNADYVVGQTAGYLIEEYHFYLNGDVLEMIENADDANPRRITFGISDLQVLITLDDGTELTEFTSSDDWTEVAQVAISLVGVGESAVRQGERTLVSTFFPRNILSN